ncbi:hypothetical protein [Hymenobacter sp. CRA2]|uniref:hypothetical protein n=1 Tax=Hymenobacter sp. CRA2 TaxID=1955620 RepID=UPI00098FE0D6|nr:hypothetical protein [Hymenobacter sp. CRA2]OON68217.1 hypothetical protein B0919_13750 [Hymenobacter sp. CRA2]
MAYTVSLLTNTADCDLALAQAQNDLRELNSSAASIALRRDNTSENATETRAALDSLASEIGALQVLLPTLPDTDVKRKNQAALRRAENRQSSLIAQQQARSAVGALNQELKLARIQAEITELNTYIGAVQARRATL